MSQSGIALADLAACLEHSGAAQVVLAADGWAVLAVSDRYLELTRSSREAAVAATVFDLWSTRPDSFQRELRSVLTAAATTQQPVVRLRSNLFAEGAVLWREQAVHVHAPSGAGAYIVHTLEGPLEPRAMELDVAAREREAQERERALDLEQTNERLLREIGQHMKTQRALKRSEEQLIQAQRLDALGRLAGGIAHDFNNLLSVIIGYSSTLVFEAGISATVRSQITEIRRAGERAADLTMQLLAFSRKQVLEPRVVNLNAALTDVESMLRRLLGEDIEFCIVRQPDLGRVRVDPGQLEQVILNLVINARDAMPTGGRLTIETGNTELDEVYTREHLGTTPGQHVVLTVSDTGCGMDKVTQERIFEPFFTTKEPGKGTGLGLSTAFGIVKQSGGSIWVYSEPGKGTTFSVFLPRVDPKSERPLPNLATPSEQEGREVVLLVEDEAQVRAVASSILRRVGYVVLEAQNIEEALALCAADNPPVELLLTDVVMPGASGRVVAERIVELKPAIKVLFMSGYTNDAVLRHGVAGSGVAFLQKPLTSIGLTRKVREVLDGKVDKLEKSEVAVPADERPARD